MGHKYHGDGFKLAMSHVLLIIINGFPNVIGFGHRRKVLIRDKARQRDRSVYSPDSITPVRALSNGIPGIEIRR